LTEQLPLAPGATLEAKAKGKTGPGGERPPGEGAAGPEAGPASPGQLPHGDPEASEKEWLTSGAPIESKVRVRLEQLFGTDLSPVRVHTDSKAAAEVSKMGAQAFTYKNHIAFAAGAYRPGTPDGDALIAHELTHFVQTGSAVGPAKGAGAPAPSGEGAHEAEADRIATQVHQQGQAGAAAPHLTGTATAPGQQELLGRLPGAPGAEGGADKLRPKDTVQERADPERTHRCIPGCTPSKSTAPPSGPAWVAGKHLSASYVLDEKVAARSNSAPSTTTTDDPTFTGNAAVDTAGGVWRYQLASVESKGRIRLVYYNADHYPAPTPEDDSGTLSNVTRGNWRTIVNDLETNKEGVSDFWCAYRAEVLHEHYHWEKEWQREVNKELITAENDIEKLSLPFSAAATAADAETVLAPQASKIFNDAMKRARATYDALGDSPGDPAYVAQAPAMVALAARVKALASSSGW
jgi:hypothetical protein